MHSGRRGLSAEEVVAIRPRYDPKALIAADPDLADVIKALQSGQFNLTEPGIFDPIIGAILSPQDPWMTAADFASLIKAQRRAATAYRDRDQWTRMSILNSAASGRFSSDRTISEYNADIWRLDPVVADPTGDSSH